MSYFQTLSLSANKSNPADDANIAQRSRLLRDITSFQTIYKDRGLKYILPYFHIMQLYSILQDTLPDIYLAPANKQYFISRYFFSFLDSIRYGKLLSYCDFA